MFFFSVFCWELSLLSEICVPVTGLILLPFAILFILKVHQILAEHSVKQEPMDESQEQVGTAGGVVIDSTMEYCRNLG